MCSCGWLSNSELPGLALQSPKSPRVSPHGVFQQAGRGIKALARHRKDEGWKIKVTAWKMQSAPNANVADKLSL